MTLKTKLAGVENYSQSDEEPESPVELELVQPCYQVKIMDRDSWKGGEHGREKEKGRGREGERG